MRADLAALVRRAQAGQRTVISIGGADIAQLAPLDTAATTSLESLVASGQLLAPRRALADSIPEPVPVWSGIRLDRVLRDLRG